MLNRKKLTENNEQNLDKNKKKTKKKKTVKIKQLKENEDKCISFHLFLLGYNDEVPNNFGYCYEAGQNNSANEDDKDASYVCQV